MNIKYAIVIFSAAILGCWAVISWSGESGNSNLNSSSPIAAGKTEILIMTSLPIVWGEQASMENVIAGTAMPAPIFRHWQDKYNISAVDSLEDLETSATDIVILAQPHAMAPADIAALDSWVRKGGRSIILTDPLLVWSSELPLGDRRRPLTTGLLSPLLDHWGLELLAANEQGEGQVELEFSDVTLSTIGIGTFEWQKLPDDTVQCALSVANVMAHCHVGRGRAILFADADFMHPDYSIGDSAGADMQNSENLTISANPAAQLIDMMIADVRK